jgi:DNA-binding IclR family transcriptional regulator
MPVSPSVPEAVARLKGMFLEVPGTRLSLADVSRLAGLDPSICHQILSALEDAHFLKQGHDGLFMRASD